jgi:DNA-binding MarR family transcriptional regulator
VDQNAAMLLAMGFRAMTDRFHELLAAEGREPLRPAHGFAFRVLQEAGTLSVTELAARLGVTKQATSKLLDELVEWGYVRRAPDPSSGRTKAVALTDRGRRYLDRADELWQVVEGEWGALVGERALADAKRVIAAYVEQRANGEAPALRPSW